MDKRKVNRRKVLGAIAAVATIPFMGVPKLPVPAAVVPPGWLYLGVINGAETWTKKSWIGIEWDELPTDGSPIALAA